MTDETTTVAPEETTTPVSTEPTTTTPEVVEPAAEVPEVQ